MSSEANLASGAASHGAAEVITPTSYIAEHLQNLNNIGGKQISIIDFSVINLDTVFWTSLMGVLAVVLLLIAARRASPGVPGRFQALVEMLVEMVETRKLWPTCPSSQNCADYRSQCNPRAVFLSALAGSFL